MQIEIWSDVVCPWCFVGKRRLERALAGFEHAAETEVVYRSFELDPSAPQHGHEKSLVSVGRKYGKSESEMRPMMQQLIDVAAEEGLDLRLFDTVHTKTVDAHRLLHLALDTGGPALQRQLKEALLTAYFEQAQDVGDHEVLVAAATAAGLDEARVREVLACTAYADAVEADIAQGVAYGIRGVPFFVIDQSVGISGAQSTEVFAQALQQAWDTSHPQLVTVGGDGEACGPDGCAI